MLPMFPSDFVPIVITQHMPAKFTKSFAGHLDAVSSLKVQEAQHLQPLAPGNVYLAPGGKHLRLIRDGVNLQVSLAEGEKVSGHRPSVDVMFQSVAQACGRRSIGVIMTGMGSDGAAGMVKLKAAGAKTIAQDRDSCLIYGMPKVAVESGAVDYVVPMQKIPAAIAKLMRQAPAEPVPA
jgi:two-component system chemotaxis response regulator CheB